jgi:AraC-like DNA-binding protein/ABC-type sugar transport system substrate-binding protein/putative methionine-R-sulfoxide reductase with GAF domain
VREAVHQRAQQLGVELVEIDLGRSLTLSRDAQLGVVEALQAQDLDALVSAYTPSPLAHRILTSGLPLVHLTESDVHHPRFVSPIGFYDIGRQVAQFLAKQLGGHGLVLAVGGGLANYGEDGRSRLAGMTDTLRAMPAVQLHHVPSTWRYDRAYPQIEAALRALPEPPDAIFGLSDSLALAARDCAQTMGLLRPGTPVVGINGDPLALAAVAEGRLAATVDTSAAEFGARAVDLACQAARGERVAAHFPYPVRFVTAENVAEIAMEKLIAIASLPNRLVGVHRERDRQRMAQIEATQAINQLIGTIEDRRRLAREIVELIRSNYGFDAAQLSFWCEQDEALVLNAPDASQRAPRLPLAQSGLLGQVVARGEAVYIPDTRHSHRFAPDPAWAEVRSRVVLPVRSGQTLLGVLDLHSSRQGQRSDEELAGLQLLADQLGIALRNVDLAFDARAARAEKGHTGELVGRAVAYIQLHHARDLSRQEIAAHVGVSENYLTLIFHREFDVSPWEYLHRYRVERAKALLRETDDSITAIAAAVGFGDPAYFSRVFRKLEGCAPREYRERELRAASVLSSK